VTEGVFSSSRNDSSDSDEGRSAGYVRTDEVASVLELKRELRETVVALELARADSLDFLGWFGGVCDSARECRGSLGGGSSGSGLSTGLNTPFGLDVLKTFTGMTGCDCNLDELARVDLLWLLEVEEGSSRGGTGALGRRGGGVTVRLDSASPESYASDPS